MIAFRGDKAFLSNFYPCKILTKESTPFEFPSVEHAFVWVKIGCPQGVIKHSLARMTAGAAKRYGQSMLARADWDRMKVEAMRRLLVQKFGPQNPELGDRLLWTRGPLVEYNEWHDNFWGSCTCPRCGDKGKNTLGKLLMAVRDRVSEATIHKQLSAEEKALPTPRCVICHKNWVNVEEGFDTCMECLRKA